ncbi:GTPase Era [Phosphitispora fastidiosa]|uniref:GTPase Era n=1 Tax=Phosphitispora fastidiosa TaxID=2837202 RepID=UPI001E29A455|nr:GTPase Era [Phosphitispora fastidiosa]MBU7005883.1 GTP-binding protein Era [Phosphitispora fastidiosa]
MNTKVGFKSGFIALVGRPNVGKSTLMNRMVGRKLAIMSDKPQTTRNKITAILTTDEAQLVFIDTPGIHKPKHKLGEYMVKVARNALKEVDVILFLIEASEKEIGPGDLYIKDVLGQTKTPVILVINKTDLVKRDDLFPLIDKYRSIMEFREVVPVSALEGDNVDTLIKLVSGLLPEGPMYYPDGMVTDQPEQAIIREIIREKVLHLTREEIPHSVAVEIEEIVPRDNDLIYVRAVIFTEKESQKGIVVGKNGTMLKKVGGMAREDIENLLGSKVYLDLWVKVKKDWRNKDSILRNLGYEFKDR